MSRVIEVVCGPQLEREVSDIFRACQVRAYYKKPALKAVELAAEGGLTAMSRMVNLSWLMVVLPDMQAKAVMEALADLRRTQAKQPGFFRVISTEGDVL